MQTCIPAMCHKLPSHRSESRVTPELGAAVSPPHHHHSEINHPRHPSCLTRHTTQHTVHTRHGLQPQTRCAVQSCRSHKRHLDASNASCMLLYVAAQVCKNTGTSVWEPPKLRRAVGAKVSHLQSRNDLRLPAGNTSAFNQQHLDTLYLQQNDHRMLGALVECPRCMGMLNQIKSNIMCMGFPTSP